MNEQFIKVNRKYRLTLISLQSRTLDNLKCAVGPSGKWLINIASTINYNHFILQLNNFISYCN